MTSVAIVAINVNALSLPSISIPSLSTFPSHPIEPRACTSTLPPTNVTSPHSSPPSPSNGATLPLPSSLPSVQSPSNLTSSSLRSAGTGAVHQTIRLLTAIQNLPVKISTTAQSTFTKVRSHKSRRPLTSPPSSSVTSPIAPIITANPFTPLCSNPIIKPVTPRTRRHSLPSSSSSPQPALPSPCTSTSAESHPPSTASIALPSHGPSTGVSQSFSTALVTWPLNPDTTRPLSSSESTVATSVDVPIEGRCHAVPDVPTPSIHVPAPSNTSPTFEQGNIDARSSSVTPTSSETPIDSRIDPASALLLLRALPISGEEAQATQSLDTLHLHSDPGATSIITSLTPPNSILSSPPSLSLTSEGDGGSVDVLLATQPNLTASTSALPATVPASVTAQSQLSPQERVTISVSTLTIKAPLLDFHSRLSTRRRSHKQYFHHHFLSTAPLCECKRFPVYSSRLGEPPSACKLKAVSHLCLMCIRELLFYNYRTSPGISDVFWTEQLGEECSDFYEYFYNVDEEYEMELRETVEERFLRLDRSMQCIVPWLAKRGVRRTCPHVAGACRNFRCCRGTKAVMVAADTA